ncbi:ArnT family glycosyltransferase [Flavobacteriaceae bacterium LMO-SS05]
MKLSLVHILLLSAFLLLYNSGKWGVIETSEARYAEISREMLVNHDYISPKLLEVSHFHKPPITYYITILGYNIFGVNAFGARFFLQIAILIQLLLIYKISLLLFHDKSLTLAAVLVYFSLPLVLISSRNLTTDAYLNTFVLASVYFWLDYKKRRNKPLQLYLFYLSLGLIFETKGPVGIIFPLFFIISYKVIKKEKIEKGIHQLFGFVIFLLIASAWYLVLIWDNRDFWSYFIDHQLKDRIFSNSFNRGKPFWYYLITIPLLGLPWFLIMIANVKSNYVKILDDRKILLVLSVTILSIFVIFSLFDTKLILYILPMFGFIAILSAKILSNSSQNILIIINRIFVTIGILYLLTILVLNTINIGYEFNISIAILICFSTLIGYGLISKYQSGLLKTAMLSYLFGCLLLISGNVFLIENEDQLNSTKPVLDFINNHLNDIENIVVYNFLLPSAKFYSNKNIITLNNGHNTVERELQFETDLKWKYHLIDLKTKIGRQQTDSIVKYQSVLISRKSEKLPDYLDFLNHTPYQKKEFGKWVIYY